MALLCDENMYSAATTNAAVSASAPSTLNAKQRAIEASKAAYLPST